MNITKLTIYDDYRELFKVSFGKNNLIWSIDNSCGKTTLIRFILFAFGFDIPSTKKITMKKYTTVIELINPKPIIIKRKNNYLEVSYVKENFTKNFNLNEDDISPICFIFGLNNKRIIENLLGSFYIDQDKGWTLLNRGKVISSNIRFNIEEFILGLTNSDTKELDIKIMKKEEEIKRYEAILNVILLSEQSQLGYQQDENMLKLKLKKANYELNINEIIMQINELKNIINNNENFINTIEAYKLKVRISGLDKEVVVSRENIVDYQLNNFILESQIRELEIRKENEEMLLCRINAELVEYEKLISVDEASDIVIKQIKNVGLNQIQINDLINQLKKEKKNLESQKKEKIINKDKIINIMSMKIKEYATELKVFQGYIDKEENYLLTHNLKEHSGSIYHKVTLCYRLVYYYCIKEFLGIQLPFIVDSPGSAEVKALGMAEMVKLIKKVVGDGQIIISSIYDKELSFNEDKKIVLKNGIFGDNMLYQID